MINNFLAMGKQPFVTGSGETKDVYLFPAQRGLSETMVVIVLICCPIMLFVKPCSACFCPEAAGMPEYVKKPEGQADIDNNNDNFGSNPNGGLIQTANQVKVEEIARDDEEQFNKILAAD